MKKNLQKGFAQTSLIDIVIFMIITIVLICVALPAYQDYKRKKENTEVVKK
jgi:Tfp pilus assembly protein PilE